MKMAGFPQLLRTLRKTRHALISVEWYGALRGAEKGPSSLQTKLH